MNYNVRYFLEQALRSVFQSATDFDFEVVVVDNHSVDGSVDMVRRQFPQVRLMPMAENLGFSKANNVGIRATTGDYVLLLNPDTIVRKDTFQKMVGFMDAHSDAGGLGVKMMDGRGRYLPESKRGFPTPWVAFCKMSGLSRLFPRSARFNGYYLGHLSRDENHAVEVLSGACMLLRRSVLDKVGLLDEAYFMYGEDIDLSFRILQAGYRNYYLSDTEIIHFKGESTRKGSFNYVRLFYKAMVIFTRKHLHGRSARSLAGLLNAAIYVRAAAAVIRRVAERVAWPLADAVLIFTCMAGIKALWQTTVKPGTVYPDSYLFINVPLYLAGWLVTFFFRGGYDDPPRLRKIPVSIGIGTVIILTVYALLPEHLRSSRGMILAGAVAATAVMALARLTVFAVLGNLDRLLNRHKRMLIIAGREDSERIAELLERTEAMHEVVGIAHNNPGPSQGQYLGNLDDVPEIVRLFGVDEIIFSLKDIGSHDLMRTMSALGGRIGYKILSEGSEVIIGSPSRDAAGELYTIDIGFHLNQPAYRRSKRTFDVTVSLALLLTFPISIWMADNKRTLLSNTWLVLTGRRTWVGYAGSDTNGLPPLKPGIIPHAAKELPESVCRRADVAYAKGYRWWMDARRIRRL